MKKLFTYIASSLLLFSCSPDEPTLQLETTPDIIISSDFKALRKAQKCVVNNDQKVNTMPKKGGFSMETKKKNTFLGKKTVDFFWVNNNESKVLMSKIITLQHVLKAQKLIGFKTQFKTLQLKDTLADVFFQEGIDKRLIESNKNREGVLFTVKGRELNILSIPKNGNKESVSKLKNSLANYLNNSLELTCFFDWDKTIKVLSTLKALDLMNESLVKICYYVNSVSNLIEPLVYFSLDNHTDDLYDKVLTNQFLQNSLSFSDQQFKNIGNYFHKHQLRLPELKIYNSSKYVSDSTSCYSREEFYDSFEEVQGVFRLKGERVNVSNPLVIPKGIKIEFVKGQEVNFTNGGFILSFSPVLIDEVKFYSSDSTGRGLHVVNAKKNSFVYNSEFNGLKNLKIDSWVLPSAVTFYESPVEIRNTKFLNNDCEDGLNLFRSEPFLLEECIFKNTFSDAFDADFSDGTLKDCVFENLGNDAIDISGSTITVSGCQFRGVADKALSSGEESRMTVDSSSIDGASLAITAKDNSSIIISNSSILNSDVVFCAFQKKKEFGPSNIEGNNIDYKDSKKDFLIEKKSSLKLNGKLIKEYEESVREILYGNEYGKATAK